MHICSYFSNQEEQHKHILFSAVPEGREWGRNRGDGGKQHYLLQMLLMMKVGEIILESALQHCQQLLVSFWSSCYRQNFPFYHEVKSGLLLSGDLQFLGKEKKMWMNVDKGTCLGNIKRSQLLSLPPQYISVFPCVCACNTVLILARIIIVICF